MATSILSPLSLSHFREVDQEEVTQHSNRKTSSLANGLCSPFTTGDDGKPEVDGRSKKVAGDGVNYGVGVEDSPPDGWPLRRVISIEEDHLPHLLQGGSRVRQSTNKLPESVQCIPGLC